MNTYAIRQGVWVELRSSARSPYRRTSTERIPLKGARRKLFTLNISDWVGGTRLGSVSYSRFVRLSKQSIYLDQIVKVSPEVSRVLIGELKNG